MALVVEDGTGKADAESFCSVAEADQYHSDRGNDAWGALAEAAKEQSLRKATDFMQQLYRAAWKGYRTSYTQALDWPRQGVVINDYPLTAFQLLNVVPTEVKRACAELALRASTDALSPDLERAEAEVEVGPVKVKYDKTAPQYTVYRSIDMLLRPFLLLSGAVHRIERS